MTGTNIQKTFNLFLAGEMLPWKEIVQHLNYAVDEINAQLNAKYPMFTDDPSADYNYFPDKYIRSVVIPGGVWHFYVVDEEGMTAGGQFQMDFNRGLYIMLRDHALLVPEEYQESMQGYVNFEAETISGERGLYVNVNDFHI